MPESPEQRKDRKRLNYLASRDFVLARNKTPEYAKRIYENQKIWRQRNRRRLRATYRKHYRLNKAKRNSAAREAREKNPEIHRVASRKNRLIRQDAHVRAWRIRKWYSLNKEHNAKRNSAYAKRNRKRRTEQQCEYIKRKCDTDLNYKLRCRLRSRIWCALKAQKSKKSSRAQELLACDMDFFRTFLESQFTPEMSWENYGSYWHVDHIIPLASLDLRDSEQQKRAFHYSNCRPLEGSENLLKSDSIPDPHQALLI